MLGRWKQSRYWWVYLSVGSEELIEWTTPQRNVSSAPFGESGKRPEKMAAAECKSTLNLLPEDLSLSYFGEGKLTQRSKRQGYRFFFCYAVFLVCFLPCRTPPPDHMQCDDTKACQTISGLVRKTRGRLIILRHAISWNLRVCLLWLTGVESSICTCSSRIFCTHLTSVLVHTLVMNTQLAQVVRTACLCITHLSHAFMYTQLVYYTP